MTDIKMLEIMKKYWTNGAAKKVFCLIMIEEIKRMCKGQSIREFYSSLMKDELDLQLICTDAALSGGSLSLAEKMLIRDGIAPSYKALGESKKIKDKELFKRLESYYFWDTTYAIFCYLRDICIDKYEDPNYGYVYFELKEKSLSGELDEVVKDL